MPRVLGDAVLDGQVERLQAISMDVAVRCSFPL